jgi:hypothetical protein
MADLIRPEDITDEFGDHSHLLDLITGGRPVWHADAARLPSRCRGSRPGLITDEPPRPSATVA